MIILEIPCIHPLISGHSPFRLQRFSLNSEIIFPNRTNRVTSSSQHSFCLSVKDIENPSLYKHSHKPSPTKTPRLKKHPHQTISKDRAHRKPPQAQFIQNLVLPKLRICMLANINLTDGPCQKDYPYVPNRLWPHVCETCAHEARDQVPRVQG